MYRMDMSHREYGKEEDLHALPFRIPRVCPSGAAQPGTSARLRAAQANDRHLWTIPRPLLLGSLPAAAPHVGGEADRGICL